MKDVLKRLKKVNRKIEAKKAELFNIQDSAYYIKVGTAIEQQRDFNEATGELLDLLSIKHGILDSLQISINLEKVSLSNYQRTLILPK